MKPVNMHKRDETHERRKGRVVAIWSVYMRKYRGRSRAKRIAFKLENHNCHL
jgi:hypothetical protein